MEYIFNVQGMHCTSCAMIIENEIDEMDKIKDVDCNYKKNILKIESDKEVEAKQLNKMFEKLGYKFEEK